MTQKKAALLIKALVEDENPELVAMLLKEKPSTLLKMLTDKDIDPAHRAAVFQTLCGSNPDLAQQLCQCILAKASSDEAGELAKQIEQTRELREAMEAGPLRPARFVRLHDAPDIAPRRAHVVLQDGTAAFALVPEDSLADALRPGDGVMLDGQGKLILYRDPTSPTTGEEATLVRRITDRELLVSFHHEEHRVVHASEALVERLGAGDLEPGARLLASSRQGFAFTVLPEPDKLSHLRFIDRESWPPRAVQMGSPPSFVDGLLQHARMAMLKPDLLLKWKQAWSKFVLLHGTTGCGKSMTVDLLSRRLAELVSEVTNVPIGDLPPRIFRLRPSQIYNKYVGESDKNMARFVREVVQVAAQPFEAPDGRVYERIPTIAVLEEIDGVGRARGQGDQVFDRILSSLLQELDPGRPHMSEHLVFWVSTTNLLKQIDTALVRRAGAQIYKMGQLNRRGFTSVLSTHLQGLPLAGPNGTTDPDATRRWFVGQVTNWLYCPNGDDPGQVKVVFANGEPATKYRRDLMTGALVARSVAEAKTEGSGLEFQTGTSAGLTTQGLMESLDRQVQSTAEQISPHNIATLLEIPEGAHVREVQRIRQPSLQPFQLRRVS